MGAYNLEVVIYPYRVAVKAAAQSNLMTGGHVDECGQWGEASSGGEDQYHQEKGRHVDEASVGDKSRSMLVKMAGRNQRQRRE